MRKRTFALIAVIVFVFYEMTTPQTVEQVSPSDENIFQNLDKVPLRLKTAVSSSQARHVALEWSRTCPAFATGFLNAKSSIRQVKDEEQTRVLFYVLELEPKGFIIVSADTDLNPIIAFSENNDFDFSKDPLNAALMWLRTDVHVKLLALENNKIKTQSISEANQKWGDYLAIKSKEQDNVTGRYNLNVYDVEIGPFLSSTWNQKNSYYNGSYYSTWNYYTPPNSAGDLDNYYCGCVATAMAQILNYFEWPVTGTGSHSYTWDSQTLSANFGATTYDWANALDVYDYISTTDVQRQATGLLSYHCGVSVDMQYGADGSGAVTSRVATSLTDFFRTSGEWYANEGSFYDVLYTNMENQKPGELAIRSTTNAGHAIVVDGVRFNTGQTKYYHLNFGWGGYSDGWYDISTSFVAGGYTWNTISGCVLDIAPIPELLTPESQSGASNFFVSWNTAILQDADTYELQQMYLSSSLQDFSDNAESGTGNWTISGYWEPSSTHYNSPVNSFHGDLYNGSAWSYPGTCTLDNIVKIDASTTISYYYWLTNFRNYQARFEIADNSANWTVLKTYTSNNNAGPILETISSAALSAYEGETVSLRFVIDYLGGSISYGSAGFYFDDFTVNDCIIGDWSQVNDEITSTSYDLNLLQSGEYFYRVRAKVDNNWRDWSNIQGITLTSCDNLFSTEEIPAEANAQIAASSGSVSAFVSYENSSPENTGDLTTIDCHWDIYSSGAAKIRLYYTSQESGNPKPLGFTGNPVIYHYDETSGWGAVASNTPVQESGDYYYIESTNAVSSFSPFTLGDNTPIAVQLTSFSVETDGSQNIIRWMTESEIDVAGFYVQRSFSNNGEWQRLSAHMIVAQGQNSSGASYKMIDKAASDNLPWYRLESVNLDGSSEYSESVNFLTSDVEQRTIPREFALYANYPNPFNPSTTIRFDLPFDADVDVTIYDARGRKVRSLIHNQMKAGTHTVIWNGENDSGQTVANGLYFYYINSGEFKHIRKMTFLK